MNDKIYESGECFAELKTANEQRMNKLIWREQAMLKHWREVRNQIMEQVNRLWTVDNSWVSIWEEQWFPGIEAFLRDLQKMGYHVYIGSAERPNNQGQTQNRYCVYLDELPDRKEWSVDGNT